MGDWDPKRGGSRTGQTELRNGDRREPAYQLLSYAKLVDDENRYGNPDSQLSKASRVRIPPDLLLGEEMVGPHLDYIGCWSGTDRYPGARAI